MSFCQRKVKMSKRTARQKISQFLRLGVLGGGVCGGLLLYKYDERTYRYLSSVLHTFLDGESAHKAAVSALNKGLYFKCRQPEAPELKVRINILFDYMLYSGSFRKSMLYILTSL